jgi:hypothetical protein
MQWIREHVMDSGGCNGAFNGSRQDVVIHVMNMDISEVAQMMPKRFAGKTILKSYKHCISSLGRLRWPRRYN